MILKWFFNRNLKVLPLKNHDLCDSSTEYVPSAGKAVVSEAQRGTGAF